LAPRGTGDLGVKPAAKTCNCKLQPNRQFYVATWRKRTRHWVDLPHTLPDYFCLCLLSTLMI